MSEIPNWQFQTADKVDTRMTVIGWVANMGGEYLGGSDIMANILVAVILFSFVVELVEVII